MKFRRHDLEKRSGGSPVIVFHHRRPPASSPLPPEPHPPPPPPPPPPSPSASGVEPTREHQFFSVPSDVCLPPSLARSFLLLLVPSSVGFPRSWLCHLVPDGRVPSALPRGSRSLARSLARSDPSISALSAPLGPAHAENGYPSFLRAHHLPPD